MKKITLEVPTNLEYFSDWTDFGNLLPSGNIILNKVVCGCGITHYFLTNNDPVILACPRKCLITSKVSDPLIQNLHYFDRSDFANMDKEKSIRLLKQYVCNPFKEPGAVPKIIVCFDSLPSVINALKGMPDFDKFTFVIDEFTCVFTDARMKPITEFTLLDNILKLPNKSIFVSATPIKDDYLNLMSDFSNMSYVTLEWDKSYLREVELHYHKMTSPQSAICEIIENFRKDGYFQTDERYGTGMVSDEAVFFINSVNTIINVIDKAGLHPEECRIIVGDGAENMERLAKLRKGFKIESFPGRDKYKELKRSITFITRTGFEGADLYSDRASIYVFADPGKDNLSLDISIDLPQIIGRCRTRENPFRDIIHYYYKNTSKNQFDYEAECEKVDNRKAETMAILQAVQNFDDLILKKLNNAQKVERYRDDYVDVYTDSNGKKSAIFNHLVYIADIRAIEIKNFQYSNDSSFFMYMQKNGYIIQQPKDPFTDPAVQFYMQFKAFPKFEDRLKFCFDVIAQNPAIGEYISTSPHLGATIGRYVMELGPDECRRMSFKEKNLRRELLFRDKFQTLVTELNAQLLSDCVYSKKELKGIIQDIYDRHNLERTAKATDISMFFQEDEFGTKRYTDEKGKPQEGYIRKKQRDIMQIPVSCFSSCHEVGLPYIQNVGEVLETIRANDKIREIVERIRQAPSQSERNKIKESELPVVTWQGQFSRRCDNGLEFLSSIMCIDIDDHGSQIDLYSLRTQLAINPHVVAFFISPSGDGLKVLFLTNLTDPALYHNFYTQLEELFQREYGVAPDRKCEPLSQPCFLSHDPEIYVNPNAQPCVFQHNPSFDKKMKAKNNTGTVSTGESAVITPADSNIAFLNKLKIQASPLSDENILDILDRRFKRYPQNYQDGNRTNAICCQAIEMCKAGIPEGKAVEYLKSRFLPTGYSERKLEQQASNAYSDMANGFGSERGSYKSYNTYKKSRQDCN